MAKPQNDPKTGVKNGILYVVATPIGNMEDITLRAIRVLGEVDLVAAEDTRRTGKLLSFHGISKSLVSYHEHNEEIRSEELLQSLGNGKSIALASSAGTPVVSDPGFRLIRKCIEKKIGVCPVPGVSAALTALCASGLASDSFLFLGFLPRKKGKRGKILDDLAVQQRTMIFFESPKRVADLVDDLVSALGDRQAVLAREMTKIHEEFIRGRLLEIRAELDFRGDIKGECTLLVEGAGEIAQLSEDRLRDELRKAMENSDEKLSSVVKRLAARYGLSRKWVYDQALEIKRRRKA